MKTCASCKEEKPFESFNKNKTKLDGHQVSCKSCEKIYKAEWYERNKTEHKKKVRVRCTRVRRENRLLLYKYYSTHPCVDCGESRPECLDLDHVRGKKNKNVSRLVGQADSWETILKEIEKCEVRCANCHRVKTARELGWYSYIDE